MSRPLPSTTREAIRASDSDRERALDLLREHWIAGRLTLDEYEERCDEVTAARFLDDLRRAVRELPYPLPEHGPLRPAPPAAAAPAPPSQGSAIVAVVLGASSLAVAVGTLGLLFALTLPLSVVAWALGRRARRYGRPDSRTLGTVGEVLGIAATAIACTTLVACAALISAV